MRTFAHGFDLPAIVLCDSPEAKFSKELCEGVGLIVGIEAAGVGKHPGVAAGKERLLQTNVSVFDTGDDAVRVDADKGDDGRTPASDFGRKTLATGAKFVVAEFISAGGGAFDDVRYAEFEVEQEGLQRERRVAE